jgi:hypothetical protein
MNIIDAVKSGKYFRRRGDEAWIGNWDGKFSNGYFRPQDILATDWEVEEERLDLSWKEIKAAVTSGIIQYKGCITDAYHDLAKQERHIKSQLGFKE